MTTYRVDVDGTTVWTDVQDGYIGLHHFPAEYRERPLVGFVDLVVDDEIISHSVPEGME